MTLQAKIQPPLADNAIHASPLDDCHGKLMPLRNLNGASNEPPAKARQRRGGELSSTKEGPIGGRWSSCVKLAYTS